MGDEPLFRQGGKTPNGHPIEFYCRESTNDAALVAGIMGEDEYDLEGERIAGWVIDVGAHIGIVALSIARDFPEAKVVAVEAVHANVEVLLKNVSLNSLSDRVIVEWAAATKPGVLSVPIIYDYVSVGTRDGTMPSIDQPYVKDCRYIGNIFEYPEGEQQAKTEMVIGMSLDRLMERHQMDRVQLLKIDCEGCEYAFLKTKAVDKVDRIIGEFHRGFPNIEKLLKKTHDLTVRVDRGGVGIFEANHK